MGNDHDCKCQKFTKITHPRETVDSRIQINYIDNALYFVSRANGKDSDDNLYRIVFNGSAIQKEDDPEIYEGELKVTIRKINNNFDNDNGNKYKSSSFTVYSEMKKNGYSLLGTYCDHTTGNKLVLKEKIGTIYFKI